MNEDHLDPDIHLWPFCDDTYELLMKELEGWNTGKWDWDGIDVCITGKYADLDPHGQQGIKVTGTDEEFIYIETFIGKTFCGEPCFDIDGIDDEEYEFLVEYFLEVATEIVCGCNLPGDWSGDDWYLHDSVATKVPIEWLADDDEIDVKATAMSIVMKGELSIEGLEDECVLASQAFDALYDDVLTNYRKILSLRSE